MAWLWNAALRKYVDAETGKAVSQTKIRKLREDFLQAEARKAAGLTGMLAKGTISVAQWEKEMRVRLKKAYLGEYQLGRGGRKQMTQRDNGIVSNMLKKQYKYLRGFAEAVQAGDMTRDAITSRSGLYFESARHAMERGRAEAWDVDLPGYPCDGGTSCKVRCKCSWSMTQTTKVVRASWKMNAAAEHCAGCQQRASDWASLEFEKG